MGTSEAQAARMISALMPREVRHRWFQRGSGPMFVWTVEPLHPIAAGVSNPIVIEAQEMYSEPFAIPAPEELVFISSFSGGEVFRSGCCFRRGRGRIFYFSPGHETYPVYRQAEVQRVIANGVVWANSEQAPMYPDRSINSASGWFE